MSADQIRNRTVGCKMTDSEYERLSAVAEGDGMTLGEWVREVLLERADGRKPSVIEPNPAGQAPSGFWLCFLLHRQTARRYFGSKTLEPVTQPSFSTTH